MENYEDIVRKWYNKLRPEILRRLTAKYPRLPLCEAENLYQDTFIAIQENLMLGRIKENTSWNNYIITIGMNLASKKMREFGKTDSIDEYSNDRDEDVPSKTARTVTDLLKTLPEEETPLCQNPEAQALLFNKFNLSKIVYIMI